VSALGKRPRVHSRSHAWTKRLASLGQGGPIARLLCLGIAWPQWLRKPLVGLRPLLSAVLAFLADGESWSSSALALALGASQRTVQRALDSLAAAGKVQSFGRGRARRWMTPPVPGFTTTLLLPAPLPSD
jgi:hypothetical protein